MSFLDNNYVLCIILLDAAFNVYKCQKSKKKLKQGFWQKFSLEQNKRGYGLDLFTLQPFEKKESYWRNYQT